MKKILLLILILATSVFAYSQETNADTPSIEAESYSTTDSVNVVYVYVSTILPDNIISQVPTRLSNAGCLEGILSVSFEPIESTKYEQYPYYYFLVYSNSYGTNAGSAMCVLSRMLNEYRIPGRIEISHQEN